MVRPVTGFSTSVDSTSASDAAFSDDCRYRWWLSRGWASGEGTLLFLGLNPSAADGQRNDPTLRRLCGFARSWGYRNLVVINLFARIASSPAVLRRVDDPVGHGNNAQLLHWGWLWAESASFDLWCGWGVGGCRWSRDGQVRQLLEPCWTQRRQRLPDREGPLCIGLTRAGHPRHPLYASSSLTLRSFVWAAA